MGYHWICTRPGGAKLLQAKWGKQKHSGPAQPAQRWGPGTYSITWRDDRTLAELATETSEWTADRAAWDPLGVATPPPPTPPPTPPPPAAPPTDPRQTELPLPTALPAAALPVPILPTAPHQALADLSVMVALFERLHGAAMRDSERTIAQITAESRVSIEAERLRCQATLAQTSEHWASLRAIEREARERIEREQRESTERLRAESTRTADEQQELEERLEELAEELARLRAAAPSGDAPEWERALQRLAPIAEQVAPIVLPRIERWLAGGEAGRLPSSGSAPATDD